MVTKAEMHTQDSIHRRLDASPQAVECALVAIYDRQTAEERAGKYTRIDNGVGFSKHDAEFLTSLTEQLKRGRNLTPRQLEVARRKTKRYWRQLITIMTTDAPPEPMIETAVRDNRPTLTVPTIPMSVTREAEEVYATW